MKYEVIVGNIGFVHTGHNKRVATSKYRAYVVLSKRPNNLAYGEPVTLFCDGEPDERLSYQPLKEPTQ